MVIFSIFQDGGRRHLGFSKGGNFRGGKGQEGQNASPSQISSRSVKLLLRYGNFSICPRWRPSAILDLRWVCLDHPRRAFGGLYHCAKFGWNRWRSFDNMHVLRFQQFGWKTRLDRCRSVSSPACVVRALGLEGYRWALPRIS